MNHMYATTLRSPTPAASGGTSIGRRRSRVRRPAIAMALPLLLLMLSASAPTSAWAAAGTASIKGVVKVEAGVPSEPVTVRVFLEEPATPGTFTETASVKTDITEGKYEVPALSEGTYKLEFVPAQAAFAFQFYKGSASLAGAETIALANGASFEANEQLPAAAVIKGVATDATTHVPAKGISVTASNASDPTTVTTAVVTDEEGKYSIPSLPAATYNVHFAGDAEYLADAVPEIAMTVGTTKEGVDVLLTPIAPHNTTPPSVVGVPSPGQALFCSPGTWTGRQPIVFTYQWRRDGEAIGGATGSLYTVQAADQGHGLSCDVGASNGVGAEVVVRTATVAVPAATVIVVTPAPVPTPALAPPAPPKAPTAQIAVSAARLVFIRRVAKAKLACSRAACIGTLSLTEPVIVTRLRGSKVISRTRKNLLLATGSFSLAVGRSATVALRLTRVGRTRLAATGSQRLPALLLTSLRGAAVPLAQRVIFTARAPAKKRG
jgi:hypothetical protein